ncbi:hypothetical protein RUM43_003488 [Polyplax serrata]|uniref:Uncharacterized protein n=1 Tax=Polyplax serrata TaxID=468196 RepID=A0AAN8NWT5_POLSC
MNCSFGEGTIKKTKDKRQKEEEKGKDLVYKQKLRKQPKELRKEIKKIVMKQSQLLTRKIFIVDKCNDPMNVTIWASWKADTCHKQKKAKNDSKRLRGRPETPSTLTPGQCRTL